VWVQTSHAQKNATERKVAQDSVGGPKTHSRKIDNDFLSDFCSEKLILIRATVATPTAKISLNWGVIALGVCCSDTQKYRLRLGFCIIRAHTSLIDEFIEEVTNLVQMKFCVFVYLRFLTVWVTRWLRLFSAWMGWFCFNEFIHEIFCGYSRTVASNLGAALFLKKQVNAIKYIKKIFSEAIKN
jgi:hypothetical protein